MKPFFSSANEKTSKLYGAISGIFSLLALLGLLMGYFVSFSPIGHAIAGGETILKGSLIGAIIEITRGSIKMPSYNFYYGTAGFLQMFLYILVLVLLCAVLLTQILTICALLLPRFSRPIALFQGRMLFFCFLLPFFANAHLYLLSEGKFTLSPFDLPCFLTALLILCVLSFSAFAERKKSFLFEFLLFCMSILCICAFFFPQTALLEQINLLINPEKKSALKVILILFCVFCLLNFAFGLVRLHQTKGGYLIDIVRSFLQFALLIALLCAFSLKDDSLFSKEPLAGVFLLLGSIGSLLLSLLFYASAFKKGRRLSRREEVSNDPLPAN